MKVFTLHTGEWDDHHLVAVFTSQEKADAYVKKFNIKDSAKVDEIEVDPLDSIVNLNKIPFLAKCKKSGKIKLEKNDIYEFFTLNSVHFSCGMMYYFLLADNVEQAIEMAEKMRQEFIYKGWKKDSNEGVQIL